MHREGNGRCCCSRKCFFHGPWLQSSANSRKGQVQLPSATGVLAFPDLPAVRFSVNTCCCGLPQRHERRHSRPRAPFQNLLRSSSVPACAQHCCRCRAAARRSLRTSPTIPKVAALAQCTGQVRGTQKNRGEPKRLNLPGEHWGWHPCGDRLAAQWRTRGKEQQWYLEDHKHEPRKD